MSEGTLTVRCPHCAHPYPMTPLQLGVYRGRSMGCMACGRSFPVVAPADAADTPDPIASLPSAVDEIPLPSEGDPPAADAPSHEPPSHEPADCRRAEQVGRLGTGFGVLFFLFTAVAACIGASRSTGDPLYAGLNSPMPTRMLQVAAGCAALALLLGLAGLMLHRRKSVSMSARRALWTSATLGVVEVLLCTVLGFMVLPRLERGLHDARHAACVENLRGLGAVLVNQATNAPDSGYADSLADAVRSSTVEAKLLVCPASGQLPVDDSLPRKAQAEALADGRHASYVYLGRGLSIGRGPKQATSQTVLAYEPLGLHDDGLHILFADGTVLFVQAGEASRIIEQLQAGQNPPPAAALVKP